MSDHLEQSHRSIGILTRFDRIFGNPSAWNHQPRNGDMNRIYHLGFLPKNKSVASLGLVHTVLKVEPENRFHVGWLNDRTEKVHGFHGWLESFNLQSFQFQPEATLRGQNWGIHDCRKASRQVENSRFPPSPAALHGFLLTPTRQDWWSPEYWSNLKVLFILLFLLQSPRIQEWRPAAQQSMRLKRHTTT